MKSFAFSVIAALASQQVAAHATFQQLWVNGVDKAGTCVRAPTSNSPITSVTSNDIRCNANSGAAASKCAVAAGQTVTVEMHQQPGQRSCANEAIGGAHYGPVQVYLSKVTDSATADGSTPWFKIFQDTWGPANKGNADQDFWGTKDLNTCCGKMNVKIPSDIAPGDYLLRAEAIALHTASSIGGAQFYVSCYQLTVSGTGKAAPAGVSLPGAYKATDPGIQYNLYQPQTNYTAPGPAVYAGGSTKKPGSACTGTELSVPKRRRV